MADVPQSGGASLARRLAWASARLALSQASASIR